MSYRRGYPRDEPVTLRQAGKIALDAFWGLGTVVIILGGILSGIFTATESAAVACVYAFIVTMFIYRDYKWRDLPRLLHAMVKTVAMVMILIGFSAAFGYMMALMQVPAKMSEFVLGITQNKYVMLMMLNILLLVLGTFMDMAPMILICTPILLPLVVKYGVDPVHFGLILMVNAGIGLDHPAGRPVAVRRLRYRQGLHRGGVEGALALLRGHDRRAADSHLRAGRHALAAELPHALGSRSSQRTLARSITHLFRGGRLTRHRPAS